MNLYAESSAAMKRLHDLCSGFGNGSPPDSYSVLGLVNDLTYFYGRIAEEQAKMFGGSQRARLQRKIEEAKHMRSFRDAGKTLGDAEKDAMLATGEEYGKEIDSMEAYELGVAYMQSLDRAIRFGISAASAVRNQESSTPHGVSVDTQ